MLRFAAIDIGSNALRLLLCNVVEEHGETHFKKVELIRIPLRLGEDVFNNGKISSEKAGRFIKIMRAFKLLIEVYEPVAFRACATASMREAHNGEELVRQVRRECGLKIEIVSGKTEAELIYANHVEEYLDHEQSYLYVDVGGGSTELTLFDKGKIITSQSFDVGSVRWLQGKVSMDKWEEMKTWIKALSPANRPLIAIGSGGNINKIFKMIGRKDKPLSFDRLKELYEEMKPMTVEERMETWGLNPDRADVIVPAIKIFLGIMKAAQVTEIIVPQIGLADGIVHGLHEAHKQRILT